MPAVAAGTATFAPNVAASASIVPALIPIIPTLVAAMSTYKLTSPVNEFAEKSLLATQPIEQRISLVGNTAQGLGSDGEMEYLTNLSEKYGLSLSNLAEQYAGMALAARRTRLEGKPLRDLFEGIAVSLAAQKTSAADSTLVLNAYSQMISKGKISMEELRQQLGEKFPLAMGIFADALGKSIPELNALVSSGSLLAEDVLPKVGMQLKKEFGQAALSASNSFVSMVNKLNTQEFKFQQNFADAFGWLPTTIKAVQGEALEAVNNNFGIVKNAITTGTISMVATLGIAAQQIVSAEPIARGLGKAQNLVAGGWTKMLATVKPFFILSFVDLIDDVFDLSVDGISGEFMNNMTKFFENTVVGVINNVKSSMNAGGDEFVTTMDAMMAPINAVKELLGGVDFKLFNLDKSTTDTIKLTTQMGLLYVMMQQMIGLGKMFIEPQIASMMKVIGTYAKSIQTNLLSFKGLTRVWNNANLIFPDLSMKDLSSSEKGIKGFVQNVKGHFKLVSNFAQLAAMDIVKYNQAAAGIGTGFQGIGRAAAETGRIFGNLTRPIIRANQAMHNFVDVKFNNFTSGLLRANQAMHNMVDIKVNSFMASIKSGAMLASNHLAMAVSSVKNFGSSLVTMTKQSVTNGLRAIAELPMNIAYGMDSANRSINALGESIINLGKAGVVNGFKGLINLPKAYFGAIEKGIDATARLGQSIVDLSKAGFNRVFNVNNVIGAFSGMQRGIDGLVSGIIPTLGKLQARMDGAIDKAYRFVKAFSIDGLMRGLGNMQRGMDNLVSGIIPGVVNLQNRMDRFVTGGINGIVTLRNNFRNLGRILNSDVKLPRLSAIQLPKFGSLMTPEYRKSLQEMAIGLRAFGKVSMDITKSAMEGLGQTVRMGFKAVTSIAKAFSGELLMLGATYVMMMFAKSDFRNPLLEQMEDDISTLRRQTSDFKDAMNALRRAQNFDMNDGVMPLSQGFTRDKGLNYNPLKLVTGENYTQDEDEFRRREKSRRVAEGEGIANAISRIGLPKDRFLNQLKEDDAFAGYRESLERLGLTMDEVIENGSYSTALTTIEEQYLDMTKAAKAYNDMLGQMQDAGFNVDALSQNQLPAEIEKQIADIMALKNQIKGLEDEKVELGLLNTDASIDQINEIDEKLRVKFGRLSELQLEVGLAPGKLEGLEERLKARIVDLNKNTDIPGFLKRPLIKSLNKDLLKTRDILKAIESTDLSKALTPPLSVWDSVNKALAETVRIFDEELLNMRIEDVEMQATLVQKQVDTPAALGNRTLDQVDMGKERVNALRDEMQRTNVLIAERQLALRKLLTVVGVAEKPELQKEITNLKKTIQQDELKVANMNLRINQERLRIVQSEQRLLQQQAARTFATGTQPLARATGILRQEFETRNLEDAKLRLVNALSGIDSSIVGVTTSLEKLGAEAVLVAAKQANMREVIGNNYGAEMQDWFISQLNRPVASFQEALDSVTPEELTNIQRAQVGTNNPLGNEMIKQIREFAALGTARNRAELSYIKKIEDLAKKLQSATEAVKKFNDKVADQIVNAENQLTSLNLDLLGKKVENQILESLKPGSTGVMKEFGNFLSGIADDLGGQLAAAVSLEQEQIKNAESLRKTREEYGSLITKLDELKAAFDRAKSFGNSILSATATASIGLLNFTETLGTASESITNSAAAMAKKAMAGFMAPKPLEDRLAGNSLNKVLNVPRRAGSSDFLPPPPPLAVPIVPLPVPAPPTEDKAHFASQKALMTQLVSSVEALNTPLAVPSVPLPQSNAAIDKLESLQQDVIDTKDAIAKENIDNALLRREDELENKLRELTKAVDGFKNSLIDAKESSFKLAESFGLNSSAFATNKTGLSEGERAVEDQRDALRGIKDEIFEQLNIERTSDDSLNQTLTAKDLEAFAENTSEASEALEKLRNSGQFDNIINRYEGGLIDFATALMEITDSIDATGRALNELEYDIKQVEENRQAEEVKRTFEGAEMRAIDLAAGNRYSFSTADRRGQLRKTEIQLRQELFDKQEAIKETVRNNDLLDKTDETRMLTQAQEEYNQALRNAQDEASLWGDILKQVQDGGITAIKDGLLGVGKALISNGEKQKETNQLDKDYAERLSELVDMYGDNADELYKAKAGLDEQRKDIEDDIDDELGTAARIFDTLRTVMASFASSIADVAAQLAATKLAEGIAGMFSGGGGLGGAISGLFGGVFGGTKTAYNGMEVSNYMMGGKVGNYNNGGVVGLGLSVQAAMQREGAGAIPIVAHKGEQILTTKNKDAQFYRSIKRNGMWDEMKRNTKNYMYGGEVGGMSAITGAAYNRHQQVMKSVNLNSNVTVIANNPSEFHRSKDQINRSQAAQMDNLSRRGLAR